MFAKKIKAMLRLTRIEHSAMLVLAVLAGELLASGKLPSIPILIASLVTPIFISMSSFAINDYFDIEVDTANKKTTRPLVSGELKPKEALYITYITLFIGVFASLFINLYAFTIAVIFGALAMLYSYKLKELLLLGNLYIAFSMAIPFVYGNFVVSNLMMLNVLLVSSMIFISGVAREIHGTIRDYEGDKKRGVVSLPMITGKKLSSLIAGVLYIIAILLSAYLFFYIKPFYNIFYLILIFITDIILFYVTVGYMIKVNKKFYSLSRNLSLAAMGLALIAILLSSIFTLAL